MRRIALALCALLACLSLATCSDPWFVGQGPSWLPLVQASFDLRAAFDGKQVGIAALERLELGGTEYVFLVTSDGSPQVRLYVLSADTLDFQYSFEQPYPNFNRTLMREADLPRRVRCGDTFINSDFSTTYAPDATIENSFFMSVGTNNYEFFSNAAAVRVNRYTPGWSADLGGNASYTSSSEIFSVVDVAFMLSETVPVHIAATKDQTLLHGGFLLPENLIDGYFALEENPLLPDDVHTGPVPAYKEGGWLTADGLIGGANSDKDDGLARYAYGTGELLDSIPMRDTHSSAIFFDPDGEHWYVYDDWSGRLYMLRTWWQR